MTRRIIGFFIVSLLLFAAGCSSLIEPEQLPSDLTVPELEARMKVAMDPKGNYCDANTYIQRVITTLSTGWVKVKVMMEVRFMKPDKMRIDTYYDREMIASIIYSGDQANIVNWRDKEIIPVTDKALQRLSRFVTLGNPEASYSSVFPRIDIFECDIDGVRYYWMRCYVNADGTGHPYDVFVDQKKFLTRRVQFEAEGIGEYVAQIQKYTVYDDVVVPDLFTTTQDGVSEDCDVILYRLNAPITDEDFKLPDFPVKAAAADSED
ncbi:MAG: hypothetical protein AB7F40_10870 [Victivallaceae bacterium]|nr:hypothetical protein [Victivallaceae bacterium]